MSIKVICPTCQQEGWLREDFRGDAITCPACSMRFRVKEWIIPAASERGAVPQGSPTRSGSDTTVRQGVSLRVRLQAACGGALTGGILGLLSWVSSSNTASKPWSPLMILVVSVFMGLLMFVVPQGPRTGGGGSGASGGWSDGGGWGDGGGGGGGDGGGGG